MKSNVPKTSMSEAKRIVWIDLEMTGLNVEKDHILEIACLVTDEHLNIVSTGPNIIIHQDDEVLNNMNQWCVTQHGEVLLSIVPYYRVTLHLYYMLT